MGQKARTSDKAVQTQRKRARLLTEGFPPRGCMKKRVKLNSQEIFGESKGGKVWRVAPVVVSHSVHMEPLV